MHTWCKNIYFLALSLCLCVYPLCIYGVSSEPNALSHTPSSLVIPKIHLKPLSHQYSLFTSYLKDFDKQDLVDISDLSWDIVFFKKRQANKNHFFSKVGTFIPLNINKNKLYKQELEKALGAITESRPQRLAPYYLQDKQTHTNKIEALLLGSKELKSPSNAAQEIHGFSLSKDIYIKNTGQACAALKTTLKVSPSIYEYLSYRQDQHLAEAPSFASYFQNPVALKPQSVPLFIPIIKATSKKEHCYTPQLKKEHEPLTPCVDKVPRKEKVQVVLSAIDAIIRDPISLEDNYNNHTEPSSFKPKRANGNYQTSLGHIHPLEVAEDGNSIDLASLKIKQEKEKKLSTFDPFIKKYMFAESGSSVFLPTPPLSIYALEVNSCPSNNTGEMPTKEHPTLEPAAISPPSVCLKGKVKQYHFKGHMKHTPSEKNLVALSLTPHPKSDALLQKIATKTPPLIKDEQKEIALCQSYQTAERVLFAAENEAHSKEEKISLDLPRNQNIETAAEAVAHYPIKNQKYHTYAEICFSKLPKAKSAQPDLFPIASLPNFLKKLHPKIIPIAFSDMDNKKPILFRGNKEAKSTRYQTIADKRIDSEIAFGPYIVNRPFTISITASSFEKDLTKHPTVLPAEKEIPVVQSAIGLPNDTTFSVATNLSTNSAMQDSKDPILLNKICLEKHLPVNGTNFEQNISLPQKTTDKAEPSFYMHPLLSLFSSEICDISKEGQIDATFTNRNLRMTGHNLFSWPTLEQLHTDSLPDGFSIQTRLLSSNEEEDVNFACTLRADEKDLIERLGVNILYILDTSKTIEPHRFNLFKKAILQSLDYLDKGTKFNIAVLSDGEIKRLRESDIAPTKSAKSYAKRFLRKIEQSGKTSFSNLVTLLEQEKQGALKKTTQKSCVLLSDGNFANNIRVESGSLKRLTAIDAGNFSLYTASVSDKNNNSMLSLLSKLNHGFSLSTRTHSSFPRKFAIMVKHIKQPIMHDITISFPDDDSATAYVNETISPILLVGKNLTIFGTSPTKKAGRVFIQGRSGDKWINILKNLPLQNARRGRHALNRKLAGQKTLFSLKSFLDTNDEKYLSDAKKYSEEYDLQTLVP